jgi:subtilisin family serine protease
MHHMSFCLRHCSSFAGAALIALAGASAGLHIGSVANADDRIPVRTLDDLPRHVYAVDGKALDVLKDRTRFLALVDQAIANATKDLATYKIEDVATLKAYYDGLAAAYSAKGDLDKALEFSDKAKALETKEQEKAMRGVLMRARVAALKSAGGDEAAYLARFREELRTAIAGLDHALVKDQLIAVRNQAKIVTRELVEASVASSLDPLIEANKGAVPAEVVGALIQTNNTLNLTLPLLPTMAEVFGEFLDRHANAATSEDRWTPRLVALDATAKATPVVVGIWDSGVDTTLFPNNLWVNPSEEANGKDDDGNGFIDDLHGIAFDLDRRPTTGPLASLAGLNGDRDKLMGFIAASQDMQAGIENERVEAFRNHYRSLKQEEIRPFTEDLGLLGSWCHGTHVAGVAIAGNPFARIVHITENWPWKAIPDEAPTVELGARWGLSSKQSVEYLRKSGARVVNMSWRVGRAAFEGMLDAKGVGASPAERAELSRQIFAELRNGLEEAIRSAPEILFIAGSGNEDNDVDFAEYVPAGLRLPNLLTVGAVDAQDRFTTFTSTGANVSLYANGYRIPSMVPGGEVIEFSGTSMAAPQVANLAAKLFALRPELKPAEVVELIRKNADPIPGKDGRFIIHPKRTIEALGR